MDIIICHCIIIRALSALYAARKYIQYIYIYVPVQYTFYLYTILIYFVLDSSLSKWSQNVPQLRGN